MVQKEFDEDYFTIGNATCKEVGIKFLIDETYSNGKGNEEVQKLWGNSEEKAKEKIRDVLLNTERGRKKLKEYDFGMGYGYNGLWALQVDGAVKCVAKAIENYLKKLKVDVPATQALPQDIFADIFMDYINAFVAEEVVHSESSYNHKGKSRSGVDNFFLEFTGLEHIQALHNNRKHKNKSD